MTNDQIQEILRLHALWLRGCSAGRRADFSGANLSGVDLSGAYLFGAYLSDANLSGANLYRANLSYANLSSANLSSANLCSTNLSSANLSGANLSRANLSSANLSSANLSRADLRSIYEFTPTTMLLANWGNLSDDLCKLAMAYDASGHEDPTAFDRWKETNDCPYGNVTYKRLCKFHENKNLWDPTIKAPRSFDLMVALIKEKCANSDWH